MYNRQSLFLLSFFFFHELRKPNIEWGADSSVYNIILSCLVAVASCPWLTYCSLFSVVVVVVFFLFFSFYRRVTGPN